MSQIDSLMNDYPNAEDLHIEFRAYCNGQITTEDLSDNLKEIFESMKISMK